MSNSTGAEPEASLMAKSRFTPTSAALVGIGIGMITAVTMGQMEVRTGNINAVAVSFFVLASFFIRCDKPT